MLLLVPQHLLAFLCWHGLGAWFRMDFSPLGHVYHWIWERAECRWGQSHLIVSRVPGCIYSLLFKFCSEDRINNSHPNLSATPVCKWSKSTSWSLQFTHEMVWMLQGGLKGGLVIAHWHGAWWNVLCSSPGLCLQTACSALSQALGKWETCNW